MPMLGDLLAAARRSAAALEGWLREKDPALAARLQAAAAAEGETPAAYLRIAVADFGRFASEEDWATLVSRLRDSPDPGSAYLVAILEWRLAPAAAVPSVEGAAR
jgi:hypothetical protein